MEYIRIFSLSILCLLPSIVKAQDDAYLPLSDEEFQTRHTAGFILDGWDDKRLQSSIFRVYDSSHPHTRCV
jgi:hypothetical protein